EAPVVYLRGAMLADTVNGFFQRNPSSLALGGTFALGCGACTNASRQPNYGLNGGVTFDEDIADTLNGNIIFAGSVIGATNIPANSLISPTALTKSGFNVIDVNSNGPVLLPVGDTLTLAANGGLAVNSGQSIEIGGNVKGPGATVSLQTASTGDQLPHDIIVQAGAIIDVSGGWINDSPNVTLQPGTGATAIKGGSVRVSAAGNAILGSGALLDVSGGGWVNQSNMLTKGTAGSISLAANFSFLPTRPADNPFTGAVVLGAGATLLGDSLSASG